jgi:hypothetical protein
LSVFAKKYAKKYSLTRKNILDLKESVELHYFSTRIIWILGFIPTLLLVAVLLFKNQAQLPG